jgi:hypothetical protein
MVLRSRLALIAAFVAAVGSSCSDSKSPAEPLVAPAATEPLTVTVITRKPIAGESLPNAHVAAAPGAVAIDVTLSGGCLPIVEARVSRTAGVIAVVGRVYGNALADCAPIPQVTVYSGLISNVAAGVYRIDIFDADADATPRYLSSTVVTVPPGI